MGKRRQPDLFPYSDAEEEADRSVPFSDGNVLAVGSMSRGFSYDAEKPAGGGELQRHYDRELHV